MDAFWDSPLVSNIAFQPRRVAPPSAGISGVLPVDGVELGYLLLRANSAEPAAPVIVYLHANAETASDLVHLAPLFWQSGAGAALSFDYRGFGWSSGTATLSTLFPDVTAFGAALPTILEPHGLAGRRLILYGRSLGGACAAHLASLHPVRNAHRMPQCSQGRIRTFSTRGVPRVPLLTRVRIFCYANLRPPGGNLTLAPGCVGRPRAGQRADGPPGTAHGVPDELHARPARSGHVADAA